MIKQKQVTEFYDQLIFPSKTSLPEYSSLAEQNLVSGLIGDFGCGQSLFLEAFSKKDVRPLFLDISENALRQIPYGLRLCASLTDIPLRNGTMEEIFCIGVVHHIPHMDIALFELMRVLKPSAKLFLGVYAEKSIQSRIRAIYDWIKLPILRRMLFWIAETMIWLKNRRSLSYLGLENRKRAEDLLLTPLVRYLPLKHYTEMISRLGGEIEWVKRISSMNIIMAKKNKSILLSDQSTLEN